jgi:CHAT domain-containing protein
MRARVVVVAGVAVLASATAFFVHPRSPRARLADAVRKAGHRPFEARLTGIDWAARPEVVRSAAIAATQPEQLHLRAIAAAIAANNAADDVRGAAALLNGNESEGKRLLESMARGPTASAAIWSDLAAARTVGDHEDVLGLCSALAAADRALDFDPSLPEARFNRAVILELLCFRTAAEKAYGDYLAVDGSSEWAAEARDRLLILRSPRTKADEWQALLPRLEHAAAAGDAHAIDMAAVRFPQEARTWAEAEFLGRWAQHLAEGDGKSAATMLTLSRTIGTTLRRTTGESLLTDSVAAIDGAAADAKRLATLTAAYVAYRQGRKAYAMRQLTGAVSELRRAQRLFDQAGSPMSLSATYYRGNAEIDAGDVAEAAKTLRILDARTPKQYRALLAQMDWLRGAIAGLDGFADRNLIAYERAYEEFNVLREEQNAADMRARIAALLTILGRTAEAWHMRRDAFAAASGTGDPWRVEVAAYSAGIDAVSESRWDIAHALFTVVSEVESGNSRLHAEALVWRALAAMRAGMTNTVAADLRAARRAPGSLQDAALREDVTNALRLVEAMIVRGQSHERAIALLTEYLASARRRDRSTWLTQVLVERARDYRASGDFVSAETDLRQAISIVEERRTAMARDDLRDSFLGKSIEAYRELSDLLDERGETAGALAVADRPRARMLLDRVIHLTADGIAPEDIFRSIEPRQAILAYSVFEKRLVIFAITRRGIERFTVPVAASDVKRLTSALATAMDHDQKTAHEQARQLGRILIDPAVPALHDVDSLVFVCDPVLQQVPFAALVDHNGQYLVETYAIMVAPSVIGCVRGTRQPPSAAPESLLVVSNPRLSPDRFASLPSLRGAEGEAREIASIYRSPTVLIGKDASTERVLASLSRCDVAHIATHAVVDPRDPIKSRLLLAGEGTLTVAEVAAMRLDRLQIVILASCRTAVATEGYGDIRTLAAGFLAAGARNVVASLWDINDEVTRSLSVALHRGLRDGRTPADALRDAQLQMLRSADPRLTEPRTWAALQLYGFGSRGLSWPAVYGSVRENRYQTRSRD